MAARCVRLVATRSAVDAVILTFLTEKQAEDIFCLRPVYVKEDFNAAPVARLLLPLFSAKSGAKPTHAAQTEAARGLCCAA